MKWARLSGLNAVLLACAVLGMGCSSIPKAAAMQAREVSIQSKHSGSVGVRASGGQQFDFRISDEQFEMALRDSLVETGVFSSVVDLGAADYRLDVVLGDGAGLGARELTTLWSLSRVDTKETVWQELVTSRGRSHHFVGVIRQRRSIEYAARENIRLGLVKLSHAKISLRSHEEIPSSLGSNTER